MKSLATLFLLAVSLMWAQDGEWIAAIRHAQTQLSQRRLPEAAESAKEAVRIAKDFGPADDRLALSYFQTGNIYREWGRCTEARANFSRAIVVWRKQPHPRPKYLFNAMISLLDVMCECEDYPGLTRKFRSFSADLQRFRSDAIDDAHLFCIRGLIARGAKHYREAEGYYRQEIELLQKTPGAAPLQIEEERVNLAMVLGQQGRHEESLAESEHVIAFLDRDGPAHPVTFAGALNNAACALADLGRKEEAQRNFERALQVAVNAVGEDTRFTARIMLNYARVLRENKETPAAQAMKQRGTTAYHRAILRDSSTVDALDLHGP